MLKLVCVCLLCVLVGTNNCSVRYINPFSRLEIITGCSEEVGVGSEHFKLL
jgi:hypothetical protein